MENKILRNLTFFLISCCIVYYFKDGGFFWDNTIFGYQMGNHLYNNGLFNFNFPDSFDPGHPPFLALLLATPFYIWCICPNLFILEELYTKTTTHFFSFYSTYR